MLRKLFMQTFRRYLDVIVLSSLAPVSAQADINVFACEPEWAQLAKELGGEHIKASSATTAYQDPHYIQARPSLIAKARRADLLICTGAELEIGWLPVLLERSANPNIQEGKVGSFMTSDHVELLEKLDYVDNSMGHVHATGHPHVQTDPSRMLEVAKALSQRFIELDPDNASHYQKLGADFQTALSGSIKQWSAQVAKLKDLPIVVHHHSWVYLNDWLNLKQVATLEPKPGVPPSASHLNQLLQQMQQTPAKVIIYAAYQTPQAANWLASRAEIPAVELPSTVLENQTLSEFYQGMINTLLQHK